MSLKYTEIRYFKWRLFFIHFQNTQYSSIYLSTEETATFVKRALNVVNVDEILGHACILAGPLALCDESNPLTHALSPPPTPLNCRQPKFDNLRILWGPHPNFDLPSDAYSFFFHTMLIIETFKTPNIPSGRPHKEYF